MAGISPEAGAVIAAVGLKITGADMADQLHLPAALLGWIEDGGERLQEISFAVVNLSFERFQLEQHRIRHAGLLQVQQRSITHPVAAGKATGKYPVGAAGKEQVGQQVEQQSEDDHHDQHIVQRRMLLE